MKILTLSIKQQYFDEILAGTKKHEYREIRPNNGKKYYHYEHDGKIYEADEVDSIPEDDKEIGVVAKKYDAIKFLTGAYVGKRPWALVEVKDAEVVFLTDENGNDIIYEHDGSEYIAAQVDYTLGKVLEKSEY